MGFAIIPTYSEAYLRSSLASGGGTGQDGTPLAVESMVSTPPTSPSIGQFWIVAPVGSAEFLNHDNKIAEWTTAGWSFIPYEIGQHVYIIDEDSFRYWKPSAWTLTSVASHNHDDRYYTENEVDTKLNDKQDKIIDTSAYTNVLDSTDNTVEKALNTIDKAIQWESDYESFKLTDKNN